MELQEAKDHFIQTWGTLGTNWGINRTMAQIHALLLVSNEALSTEDVMTKLNISRGNSNMNLRELITWGLVRKEIKPGERREYFVAEKDMWEVSKCIIRERKKRELDQIKRTIDHLSVVEGDKKNEEYKEFVTLIEDMRNLTTSADKVLNRLSMAEKNWLLKKFLKLFV
jgi:DNA-binding transcriptional regulator GbsR (MarR family)